MTHRHDQWLLKFTLDRQSRLTCLRLPTTLQRLSMTLEQFKSLFKGSKFIFQRFHIDFTRCINRHLNTESQRQEIPKAEKLIIVAKARHIFVKFIFGCEFGMPLIVIHDLVEECINPIIVNLS
jgi:hypothetical protein